MARLAEAAARRRPGRRGRGPRARATAPGTSTRSTAPTTSCPASRTGAPPSGWWTRDGPLLGAVYYPAVDELWVGGRDHPTTLNGVPVPQLADRPLSRGLGRHLLPPPAHGRPRPGSRRWQAATAAAATVRMLGSASIDLAGRGQRPARGLPAGQPASLGLVSRAPPWCSAPAAWPKNWSSARTAGRSPATPRRSHETRKPSRLVRRRHLTRSSDTPLSRSKRDPFDRLESNVVQQSLPSSSERQAPAPSWATPATAVGSPSW